MGACLTTSRNIITAIIDVRGTGFQSNEYKFEVYRKLGILEVQDIINVTQILSKNIDFIT